ncbi:MAG TPA: TIGR02206 family membrane protein [Firmicutes bacterium]|nr:TIGR02206 family membrane protein [Bacillota bacterium]
MHSEDFELFSPGHLLALALVVAALAGTLWAARRVESEQQKKRGAALLAFGLLGLEVVATVRKQLIVGFDPMLSIPLHLCDLAFLAMFGALLTRRRFLYEFAYFFGFGGAFFALLTPNLDDPLTDFFSIRYFISHSGVCLSMVYLTIAFGLRPTWRSVPRMFVAGNLYMVLAGAVNWLAGTNFGYLSHKPAVPTLLDHLGPWPYYLIWYEVIALVVLPLLYLPFYFYDRVRGSQVETRLDSCG